MPRDPIVDEVRKIRDEYAKQFNYDIAAICRDLREKTKQLKKEGWKLVALEGQRKKTTKRKRRTG